MSERITYAYSAIFDTPEKIVKAAKRFREKGYTDFDVNTPYPVHGLDSAMKLPSSKLGYAALVFGVSAALAALAIMFWMVVLDYPIVIGGKPFFAFPAFVPIIFEVTVLSASIGTVTTMIALFFKFPNISHPIHDTDYLKYVSSDRYGIYIKASDPVFDKVKIKALFDELGAEKIISIYWEEEKLSFVPKTFDKRFMLFLFSVGVITSIATYFTLNKIVYMPPFSWMSEQSKVLPQTESDLFSDGFGMRKPVLGTIKQGSGQLVAVNDSNSNWREYKNPITSKLDNFEAGKDKYNIYCCPCHGYFGRGESRLRGQFPNPPSIHSEKIRMWKDGEIFRVMKLGQNVMPSYSTQINDNEMWQTVLYIRALQRAMNAKESDLNE